MLEYGLYELLVSHMSCRSGLVSVSTVSTGGFGEVSMTPRVLILQKDLSLHGIQGH